MSLESVKWNKHNLLIAPQNTEGIYDIGVIRPVHITKPQLESINWVPFNFALTDTCRSTHGVHFFIDDYVFERTWKDPARYATLLQQYKVVLTPDFSLFADYPKAVQIYNHYRKHVLGAWWQSLGMVVIPSICWSDRESFSWCFDGEPVGGTVAVSSVGTQSTMLGQQRFLEGYNEMLRRLKPETVLFFGKVPKECDGNIVRVETFYNSLAHNQRKRYNNHGR